MCANRDEASGYGRVLTLDQVASWCGPPLILFVGVTTTGSLAHTVFQRWAALLGRTWTLRGVDLPTDTPPQTYRQLVSAMRDNPAVRGAVITAHKLRLYRVCAPDLAGDDPLVGLTHEVNTLVTDTSGATVTGYARDAVSLTLILPELPRHADVDSLRKLHVLCLGAGGAATALLLALHIDMTAEPGSLPGAPAHIVFADTDPSALDDLRAVAARAMIDPTRVSFVHAVDPGACDALVASLRSPALVINATGRGKEAPGSPVTYQAPFRPTTLAWDFNYRGPLTFLHQATTRGARTLDGWDYFVAGWAGSLTSIAGIPFTSDLLTRFAHVAKPSRPRETR